MKKPILPFKQCFSTHGGAGYATNSHWDGNDIICGSCGFRIQNPHPTGSRSIYVRENGILGWLGFQKFSHEEPTFPPFILGSRGRKWKNV